MIAKSERAKERIICICRIIIDKTRQFLCAGSEKPSGCLKYAYCSKDASNNHRITNVAPNSPANAILPFSGRMIVLLSCVSSEVAMQFILLSYTNHAPF